MIDWKGIAGDLIHDIAALRAEHDAASSPPLDFFFQTEPLCTMAAQPTVCRYSPCVGSPISAEEVVEVMHPSSAPGLRAQAQVLRSKECVGDDAMDSFIVLRLQGRFALLYLHIEVQHQHGK